MVSGAAREYAQTVDPAPVILPAVHENSKPTVSGEAPVILPAVHENPKPTVSGEAPVIIPVHDTPVTPETIAPPTHTSPDISKFPDTQVST